MDMKRPSVTRMRPTRIKPKIFFLLKVSIFFIPYCASFGNDGRAKPKVRFFENVLSDKSIELSLESGPQETIYYTVDGSIPRGGHAKTYIYEGPIHISEPQLVRAYAEGGAQKGQSAIRSRIVLPKRWQVTMGSTDLWPRKVSAVYITGEMRHWNTHHDGRFALKQKPDGTWAATLPLYPEPGSQYKFIVVFQDGEWIWHVDPHTPQVGHFPYNAHVVPDPIDGFFNRLPKVPQNFFDDSLIFFQKEFVADVSKKATPLKHCVEFPKGQIESLSLLFSNSQSFPMVPSGISHHKHAQWLQQYCTQFGLDQVASSQEYVFVATKGGRTFYLGPSGLQAEGHFSFSSPDNETFPFQVSPDRTHINGTSTSEIPHWAMGATWYQIFPDRFRKGQPTEPPAGADFTPFFQKILRALPTPPQLTAIPWDQNWFSLSSREWAFAETILTQSRENRTFQKVASVTRDMILLRRYGGDFQGIREKIPYLKSLGIDAVYLNPIFHSPSLHKYDAIDYRHVDPAFGPGHGTRPDLQRLDTEILQQESVFDPATWGFTSGDIAFLDLVEDLHKNGMKVVIDGVFNHSSVMSPFMEDVAKKGPNSPFFPWFDLLVTEEGTAPNQHHTCPLQDYYPDGSLYPFAPKIVYSAWWGFCGLPNHKNTYAVTRLHPTLKEFIFQVMKRWMTPPAIQGKSYGGIDGVRLDVYSDVPKDFWRAFRKHVKSLKPEALIIAEEWHDGVDILHGDQADGIMNYNVRTLAESWLLNTVEPYRFTPSQARGFAEWKVAQYKDHVALGLWSMLSSHDTDRVISKTLEPNRRTSARPYEANMWNEGYVNRPDQGAWYSNSPPNAKNKELFKALVAFQMAYPGSPLIYYGDELGMWGAGDPTCRKPMAWPDTHVRGIEMLCRPPYHYCPEVMLDHSTAVSTRPDLALLDFYRGLTGARKRHPSLRYGTFQPWIEVNTLEHGTFRTGFGTMDHAFIWGFARDFGPGLDQAYFVSNGRRGHPGQEIRLKTAFPPGAWAKDWVTQRGYRVDGEGWVTLYLEADRAALVTVEPPYE